MRNAGNRVNGVENVGVVVLELLIKGGYILQNVINILKDIAVLCLCEIRR